MSEELNNKSLADEPAPTSAEIAGPEGSVSDKPAHASVMSDEDEVAPDEQSLLPEGSAADKLGAEDQALPAAVDYEPDEPTPPASEAKELPGETTPPPKGARRKQFHEGREDKPGFFARTASHMVFWRSKKKTDDWISPEELVRFKSENLVLLKPIEVSRLERIGAKRLFGAFSPGHVLLIGLGCAGVLAPVFMPRLFKERPSHSAPNRNALLMGTASGIRESTINFVDLKSSNRLTKDELYKIRRERIAEHPELLKVNYVPSDAVFKRIRDDKNWFGTLGFFYHGPGPQAFEGPPAEGRSIANPFLLIQPEFWGLSIWQAGNVSWRKDRITAQDLERADFPLYPRPSKIVYKPRESTIEVEYDITAYTAALKRWTAAALKPSQASFGITAYNARDLGMRFIKLNLEESVNISNPGQPEQPVFIGDMLTFFNVLCGPEGGCNHRNNVMPLYTAIAPSRMPATAVFDLWHKKPKEPKNAEIKYVLNLK